MKIQTTQKVWNPDFFEDLIELLNPDIENEKLNKLLEFINESSPTTYEKLQTLIDRIEFISHLNFAKAQAIAENFVFQGKEVKGINWDIDALNLYLALSCVDILSSNFEPFDKWMVKNCKDFDPTCNIQDYIKSKSDEYRSLFQLSSNFSRAFLNASSDLQAFICNNVSVIQGEESVRDLGRIVSYLYRIRNKYTHEGRRFHSSPIHIQRNQNIGPRDDETLKIEPGFDLTNTILKIAKEQANRTLKIFAEQMAQQRTC